MEKWINNKKNENKIVPLYLCGIGNVANEVYATLMENGTKIDGVFVTVPKEETNWNGFVVQSWDTLAQNGEVIDIILGHAQYHKGLELEKNDFVRCVYYIYSPFKTHQAIDIAYCEKHYMEFRQAYYLFKEDYSKSVFKAYLESKLNEDISPILKVFKRPMTFFDNDIFKLKKNESYVDIGAYNGDTIKQFLAATSGEYRKIYAYEPDMLFYKQLVECIEKLRLNNISLNRIGIWNKDGRLYFETDDQQSGKIADVGDSIDVSRLDTILEGETISIIKINMSGSISECLEGAEDIIKCNKPKVIVNVSLVRDALWRVPLLLKEYNDDYNFYLRFNESMPSRLTLYAL